MLKNIYDVPKKRSANNKDIEYILANEFFAICNK
jgi:hypothetical protein